ncbi:MAG: amidophosphoribosyltransferase [Bacilli bacterium]|nr:amidophosphoribosyltransferase [Bacilli bacterium]
MKLNKIQYLQEECGLLATINEENAAETLYYGLHSLQHRGQDGCGITTVHEGKFYSIKGEGLIVETFDENNLKKLIGTMGIGHVIYENNYEFGFDNIQPLLFKHNSGDFAIALNGSIVNSHEIRRILEERGSLFRSDSDAELIAHMIISNKDDVKSSIIESLRKVEGGFTILVMTKEAIYVCRDKHGLKPLSLGKLNGGYIVASETCAFQIIGATFIRDIIPGEVLELTPTSINSYKYSNYSHKYLCAMEYAYFSRPDSDLEGINVHSFRRDSGKVLARDFPVEADIVIGVPDSSLSAAMGYAEESKLPYETGFIKNRYIGRTFIQPTQIQREKSIKLKLSPITSVVKDKRVVLVDDSIVRGTTSKRMVTLLKEAGATEVHVRIGTPQITHPCFYGVDFTTYEEIIGATKTKEEIKENIGADSLEFLKLESLYEITKRKELCHACFTGRYMTNIYQSLKEVNKRK